MTQSTADWKEILKLTKTKKKQCPHCLKWFGGGLLNHTKYCKLNPNRKQPSPCKFCGKMFLEPNRSHHYTCKKNPKRYKYKNPEAKPTKRWGITTRKPLTIFVSLSLYLKQKEELLEMIEKQVKIDLLKDPHIISNKCSKVKRAKDQKILGFSIKIDLYEKLVKMRDEGYFMSISQYIRYVMNNER